MPTANHDAAFCDAIAQCARPCSLSPAPRADGSFTLTYFLFFLFLSFKATETELKLKKRDKESQMERGEE